MHKLLIGAAVAAFAGAVSPAAGQTVAPAAPTSPGTVSGAPAPSTQQVRVRMMSDRVMTREEVVQHVRRMFARFDTNHDGYITRDEIASASSTMMAMHGGGAVSPADRAAVFDRLDTNHDGSISRQEFMAGEPQMREQRMIIMREHAGQAGAGEPRGERMHGIRMGMAGLGGRLFDVADSNHDGRVSLQEAEAAALAHFDRADLNHDGKLTPEERRQAHQMMRQHSHG